MGALAVEDSMAETAQPASRPRHRRKEAEIEFSRIVAFSDGVFVIAITLLVLALEVPAGADLGEELKDRGSELFAYFLSFAVLARFWLAHHRFFGSVASFDGILLGLNLIYLAWVALVPFTSEVLGEYSGDSLAIALYAFNLAAVSFTFVAQIVYAYHREHMHEDARNVERRFAGRANFVVAAVFAASIPVAFLSPTAAIAMWIAVFAVGRPVGDWIAGRRAPR
jgi:uncharacterized membrane protein